MIGYEIYDKISDFNKENIQFAFAHRFSSIGLGVSSNKGDTINAGMIFKGNKLSFGLNISTLKLTPVDLKLGIIYFPCDWYNFAINVSFMKPAFNFYVNFPTDMSNLSSGVEFYKNGWQIKLSYLYYWHHFTFYQGLSSGLFHKNSGDGIYINLGLSFGLGVRL